MFGFFKRNTAEVEVKSLLKGKVVDLKSVPDEVFSSKMVGDGFAIEPYEDAVYSPVDGVVVQVFPTGHAIGIKTNEGLEILIHIGIDTVEMKGRGFTTYVKPGDVVKAGDRLISFDTELIRKEAKSTVIPVIITNMELVKDIKVSLGDAERGDNIAVIRLK
ncbi:Glucose-specific phosphotransferase enzyme IIA component [Caloramator mitchellensis]|uniref:Glucose-specific phosphotransferase enzyme IIA component n=1 Tax=Caloramator mitchellensis TaxID=908809 RepID=A0A0R3JZQ0_CALMK|nr:PTS glucose transporter subunit IIA [Caloramator mitchellensis]KRQ86460.1 Glucose-specific phosphotransferase enzyme IIA component [Caloramator mitchellensis]